MSEYHVNFMFEYFMLETYVSYLGKLLNAVAAMR